MDDDDDDNMSFDSFEGDEGGAGSSYGREVWDKLTELGREQEDATRKVSSSDECAAGAVCTLSVCALLLWMGAVFIMTERNKSAPASYTPCDVVEPCMPACVTPKRSAVHIPLTSTVTFTFRRLRRHQRHRWNHCHLVLQLVCSRLAFVAGVSCYAPPYFALHCLLLPL